MRRATAAALCCGMIAVLASGAGAGVADAPDAGTWVTDGAVYAIARDGDRTFVGGRFAHVGPRTGPGLQLAPAGAPQAGAPMPAAFPEVSGGSVRAVISDRAGGWYLGGDFATVDGVDRTGLAHLAADGSGGLTVDPAFDPRPAGSVHALALGATGGDADVLYIGGRFESLGGDVRYSNFAAVGAADGVPVGTWPTPDGTVTGLDVLRPGGTGTHYPVVFLAGEFGAFGSVARKHLAAIWGVGAGPTQEGTLTPFAQTATLAKVRTIHVGEARSNAAATAIGAPVYLGGDFGLSSFRFTINTATGVAAGQAYGTMPAIACVAPCVRSVRALATSADGETLYIGGRFETVAAQPRQNLAAVRALPDVHPATAPPVTLRSWRPDPNGSVGALALSDPAAEAAVYAGGDFTEALGVSRLGLAALSPSGATVPTDPNDAAVAAWDPRVAGGTAGPDEGVVNALASAPAGVYAGGSFTTAGASRHDNIAAFDSTGKLIDDWDPSADGAVFALAAGNERIYLGGLFGSVDGETRTRLAAVATTGGGELDPGFAPAVEPACSGAGCDAPAPGVLSLALTDRTLYVGGSFAALAGAPRSNAGAVDALDGTALGWAADPDGTVYSLLATCATVYAGGGFSKAGGQQRSRIAALDPVSGAATGWNPTVNDGAVYVLARDSDVVYVGGSFAKIGGTERKRLAALDATSGLATSWSPSVPGTADYLRALAVPPGGTVVYAGGQLTTASGRRTYAAAFDREAGDRTEWDSGADGPVRTLAPAGDALLLGGEFRQLGSRMQQGFGSFGLPDAAAGEQLTCAPPPPPPPPEEPIVEEPPPPPPPPPAPRPAEPYRDMIAPVLGRVRFTHRRFRIRAARGARGAKRSRVPVGTRIRYALSEPAVLRLRLSRGTRVRCRSRAAKRPCYRWRRAGSLGHLSRAGSVAVAFRGRVGRHWLRAGRYRVWIQAVDPAGNRSAVQRRAFVVVRE